MENSNLQEKFKGLVRQALDGNESAQSELIDLTQAKLFKFCLLLGHNKELAEDICQEAYIKAFLNLKQLKQSENFQGWLYQIAKNLYFDLKRSSSQKETPIEELPDTFAESSDWLLVINVRRVLSQFDLEDRYLILLIELEGYSYQEAAELTGTTEDTVRSKLHRLRKLFIKKFKSDETNEP